MSDPARAILPAEPKFLPPWRWKPLGWWRDRPWWNTSATLNDTESLAAAEEMTAALFLAMRHLPPIYYEDCRSTPIYDTQSAAVEEEVPFS